MNNLSRIARIFKQHQIMSVQADRSVLLAFVVEVLVDVDDAGVVVMRSFREQIGDPAVGFAHQVVDDQQSPSSVQQIRIGQTFDKFDAIREFVKQFALQLAVAPHDSFGRFVDHRVHVFQELGDEVAFAALTRTDNHVRARMPKTNVEVYASLHLSRARK